MRASKIMQKRVENTPNIEILWNTSTDEVLGEKEVEAMRVVNNVTGEKRDIPISGFFVAIGHKPNTDIFKDYLERDEAGYLLVEPGSSKTKVAAPSPITKPFLSLSNGRDASVGLSFHVERARAELNPPIAIGVIEASAPPVTIKSAEPR